MLAILPTILSFQYPAELETYDLDGFNILAAVCLSLANLLFYSSIGLTYFYKEPKRLGWFISAVNSLTMLVHGTIYLVYHILHSGHYFGVLPEKDWIQAVDNYSAYVCIWFGLANAWDLVFGLLFYPEVLDPLTAYLHHTIFIWISFAAFTGNGIFTSVEPFSSGLLLLAVEELPTFILALGCVFPQCRHDVGFGISFFLLRIVYHLTLFLQAIRLHCSETVIVLFTLSFILHAYWFHNWLQKYGKSFLPILTFYNADQEGDALGSGRSGKKMD